MTPCYNLVLCQCFGFYFNILIEPIPWLVVYYFPIVCGKPQIWIIWINSYGKWRVPCDLL